MGANQSSPTERPTLLKLPGELRNRIYRCALLESTTLLVTSRGHVELGLLLVSKEIQQESVPIYYLENRFLAVAEAYDGTASVMWPNRLNILQKQYGVQYCIYNIQLGDPQQTPNWPNLKEWLEIVHSRKYPHTVRTSLGNSDTILRMLLTTMFEVVLVMSGKPWSQVEGLLEHHHQMLVKLDQRWQ